MDARKAEVILQNNLVDNFPVILLVLSKLNRLIDKRNGVFLDFRFTCIFLGSKSIDLYQFAPHYYSKRA